MEPVERLKPDDFKQRLATGIFKNDPIYVAGFDYRLAEKINEIMDVLGVPEPERKGKHENPR